MNRLILVTNDDGYQAQGIQVLATLMQQLGDVITVAPDSPRSGMSCSITCSHPVRLTKISDTLYSCSGTPTDCVKIACDKILPRIPDLVVSGINHGDNASAAIHYSGTMGAAIEASMEGIPAIGYSLMTTDKHCDFTPYQDSILRWARRVLADGLPKGTCLNINFPQVPRLAGERICRQALGAWSAEWVQADTASDTGTDINLYNLTGQYTCFEPLSQDTDIWALEHGYASISPVRTDMTESALLHDLQHRYDPDAL